MNKDEARETQHLSAVQRSVLLGRVWGPREPFRDFSRGQLSNSG